MVPSLPMLSCESSVSVKENADRKKNSTIIHAEKLNKKTIEVLFNKILTTNKEENEDRIEAFTHENNIMHK